MTRTKKLVMLTTIIVASMSCSAFAAKTQGIERALKLKDQKKMVRELSKRAKSWRKARAKREVKRIAKLRATEDQQELSPTLAWIGQEKIRTTHTPMATDKLIQYADDFKSAGLNSHMLASWHWDVRASKMEPDLRRLDKMATEKEFKLFLWTAWYWYPDDEYWVDRNAFQYLGKKYRGTVDVNGDNLWPNPCPFAKELWSSMINQTLQAARWSSGGGMKSVVGLIFDFEHYGAVAPYSYEHCFCDDCFDTFLRAINSKIKAVEVKPANRFNLLKKSGALEAYYELLTDRAREKAVALRQMVNKIDPDFLLGFYCIPPPLGVFETSLDEIPKRGLFASWFAQSLFEGLGTKRTPVIYAPLIMDTQRDPLETRKPDLIKYIGEQHLNVLYCPGYLAAPGVSSKQCERAITASLKVADGFWFNELWMLWAYKEDSQKSSPGLYQNGYKVEPIENYWLAIELGIKNWQKNQAGLGK